MSSTPSIRLKPLHISILIFGCLIALLSFGPRSTMGFFMTPVTEAHGWGREIFALAIALQNLFWGIGQPIAGMVADRFGTYRTLMVGTLFYISGLYLMAEATTPLTLQLTAGVLVGLGVSGTSMMLVLASFARLLPENLRTIAFGIGTASGSLGQFLFAPLGQHFIHQHGWQMALLLFAVSLSIVPFLAIALRGKPDNLTEISQRANQTIRQALAEAFGHRSYLFLVAGFFVCGFHVAFITTHLPAFITDVGIDAKWGAWAIGLIGLFNIIGALSSGFLSNRYTLRYSLCFIYFARAAVIAVFILLPISTGSILVFSAAMGLLWLSTVPPTQGLVAVMFGTRYLATLFGFVFLSHQIGAFLGVWLGGFLYDVTGAYEAMWWLSILLGLMAALLHWPIKEQAIDRFPVTR
ncbi:MAG: MFS transporter [Gammaproteobacteria bacterium]|nr:MFS transporter [Gammaproteobacteria bacterium]